MKRFRRRSTVYIVITAILLSLFSISSLTLGAFATDDGESSAVSQPEYTPAPALPIEMVVPSDELYMNYPDVAVALECLPVEPLPDDVTLFQYFERLWVVEWLEAEIEYAAEWYDMPADEAAALTDTYVTSFYTRAEELGLNKYVPISNTTTFAATDLQNAVAKACWEGTGSVTDPYLIKNQYDLEYLAFAARIKTIHNCYFRLENDITLVGYNDSNSWVPIGGYARGSGDYTSTADVSMAFRGTFDGNNKTISNLYINTRADDGSYPADNMSWYAGLFGAIGSGSEIKNLTVTGTVKANEYVGGIAGYINGATALSGKQNAVISNCTANVSVTGNFYVGGIVGGAHNGTINKTTNNGTVTRLGSLSYWVPKVGWYNNYTLIKENVYGGYGGIVGVALNFTINACTNTGTVQTNQTNGSKIAYTGGIVGLALDNVTVTDTQSSGEVVGTHYIGGIVGTATNSTIVNCLSYNKKTHASGGVVGGILGRGDNVTIRGCANKSVVYGYNYAGGIVGNIRSDSSKGSVVEDCINGGEVGGEVIYIGGIVGSAERIVGSTATEVVYINYCRNYGFVNADHYDGTKGGSRVGGIAGLTKYCSVETCTNSATVRAGSRVGGIIGEMICGEMIMCHNTADGVLQIMGADSGENETYDLSPLGGGFVGCLEVDGSTRLQASFAEGRITAYRSGAETPQASEWENVASRIGWAALTSGTGKTRIWDYYDQSNSLLGSEGSQLLHFYLLLDRNLSQSGKAYGTEGSNLAVELFPSRMVYKLKGLSTGYVNDLKTNNNVLKAWSLDEVYNDYGISAGGIRVITYTNDNKNILREEVHTTSESLFNALWYWWANGNTIGNTSLKIYCTNRMQVRFEESGNTVYLSPYASPTFTAKVTYSLGTGAPSGVTKPSDVSETKTIQGRNPSVERSNALNAENTTINAASNLGSITIGSITGLSNNSTVYNNLRYYFLGYKDANGKWYQPGDTISYSLWGDRADYTLTLTAQWVSGYSVRYAVADSLVTDGGAAFSFVLPIDQTLYTDDSALITVMAPERYETFLGRFSYWSLNQQGTGTRYYPGETYTLSQLGVSNGEVVFYFAQPVWDLTVNTQMNGPYVEGSFIEGQTDFVYTLENESIGFRLQFIVPAQQSVTITEIPANVDDYTLTQHSGWAWKHQSKEGIIQYNDNGTWVDWESAFGPFTNYVTFAPYNGKDINVTFINAYYNGVYNTNLKGGVA